MALGHKGQEYFASIVLREHICDAALSSPARIICEALGTFLVDAPL